MALTESTAKMRSLRRSGAERSGEPGGPPEGHGVGERLLRFLGRHRPRHLDEIHPNLKSSAEPRDAPGHRFRKQGDLQIANYNLLHPSLLGLRGAQQLAPARPAARLISKQHTTRKSIVARNSQVCLHRRRRRRALFGGFCSDRCGVRLVHSLTSKKNSYRF